MKIYFTGVHDFSDLELFYGVCIPSWLCGVQSTPDGYYVNNWECACK